MDNKAFTTDLTKCLTHLKEELAQIRTGRATTELLEGIKIEAYGTVAALTNYGNISVADAKSLVVQVWDKTIVDEVSKGITAANLGLGISIEGDVIRISVPDLTEERRKDLVKVMGNRVETARISVRNVRRKYMKILDEEVKNGLAESESKRQKQSIEDEVKLMNKEIEEVRKLKEEDLMTV